MKERRQVDCYFVNFLFIDLISLSINFFPEWKPFVSLSHLHFMICMGSETCSHDLFSPSWESGRKNMEWIFTKLTLDGEFLRKRRDQPGWVYFISSLIFKIVFTHSCILFFFNLRRNMLYNVYSCRRWNWQAEFKFKPRLFFFLFTLQQAWFSSLGGLSK